MSARERTAMAAGVIVLAAVVGWAVMTGLTYSVNTGLFVFAEALLFAFGGYCLGRADAP